MKKNRTGNGHVYVREQAINCQFAANVIISKAGLTKIYFVLKQDYQFILVKENLKNWIKACCNAALETDYDTFSDVLLYWNFLI